MHLLELSSYVLHVAAGFVEPRVTLQLIYGVAVLSIVAEQLQDHVLKVSGEARSVDFFEISFDLTS